MEVAPEALRDDKTIGEIARMHDVHPSQVTEWRHQLLERAADVFGGSVAAGRADSKVRFVADTLTLNPSREWSFQVSYADLDSPEQLEPELSTAAPPPRRAITRSCRSANGRPRSRGRRNDKRDTSESKKLDAWALVSTLVIGQRHTVFGRYERCSKTSWCPKGCRWQAKCSRRGCSQPCRGSISGAPGSRSSARSRAAATRRSRRTA